MRQSVIQRVRLVLLGVFAVVLLGAGNAYAQIVNESFEDDGQFSLRGWQATDQFCQEGAGEAAPGGGLWALKLHRRNLQGGCYGVVYQVVPQVEHDQVWRVRAWVRVPEGRSGAARLYWTKFDDVEPAGVLPYQPAPYGAIATTTSTNWTALTLIDTLKVAPGDSIGIVLDGGVTSGPTANNDFAYFDLITVDQPTEQEIAAGTDELPEAPVLTLDGNFPNPFRAVTTISFTLNRADFVTLDIYNVLGRKVSTLVADQLPSGTHSAVWEAHNLPDGLYIGRLRAGTQGRTIKLVRQR